MKQPARYFAAFGGIMVVMYSMFLTFIGARSWALFSYEAATGSSLFINPPLLCGLAGLAAAGLGLAAAFLNPRKITMSRIFVCTAAAVATAIALVMVTTLFEVLLTLMFGLPALILAAAAVIALTPGKNKSGSGTAR